MMSRPTRVKRIRTDAISRRRAILVAARKVFEADGVEAPIEQIALAAGVGRATVHRNFYDRKGLLIALLDEELDQFAQELASCDLQADPFALIAAFTRLSLSNVALLPHWQAMNAHEAEFGRVRQKFIDIIDASLPAVKSSGKVRSDLTSVDLELIAGMLGAALKGETEKARRDLTARALILIGHGIKRPS